MLLIRNQSEQFVWQK